MPEFTPFYVMLRRELQQRNCRQINNEKAQGLRATWAKIKLYVF
jgi:hypothetical protein